MFKLWVAITYISLLQGFPDVPIYIFSNFIQDMFSSNVSLATVLLVLFSLTENTELLSLHAHQQNPKFKGKNKTVASGWMRALSSALLHQLKGDFQNLFHNKEFPDEKKTADYKIVHQT